jgi:hypothetical protein
MPSWFTKSDGGFRKLQITKYKIQNRLKLLLGLEAGACSLTITNVPNVAKYKKKFYNITLIFRTAEYGMVKTR